MPSREEMLALLDLAGQHPAPALKGAPPVDVAAGSQRIDSDHPEDQPSCGARCDAGLVWQLPVHERLLLDA